MKILLATGIYPPDAGGPATYTRALARALYKDGKHQVEVVCYGSSDQTTSEDGFPVHHVDRNRSLFLRYRKFEDVVYRYAKDCDVVYLQGPVSEGFPGMRAARRAKKPTVMKIVGDYAWEVYANGGGEGLLEEAYRHRAGFGKVFLIELIERWTARRAGRIIVPSHFLKTIVMKWGVSGDRIQVIENAVEQMTSEIDRNKLRSDFKLENKRVYLTAVRAVPWKRVDFLITLMNDLPQDTMLVVAGDGPSLTEWKALAEKMKLGDRVLFLGRQARSALAAWYGAADAFLLPSGYEGFPHVIPEAVSAGLPCFVSDRGGNPETADLLGKYRVQVLPYQDADAWKNALTSFIPTRNDATLPGLLQMEEMIKRTTTVLEHIV